MKRLAASAALAFAVANCNRPTVQTGNRAPVPAPNEPTFTTVNRLTFPMGRWFDLNPGNYLWVTRLEPGQRFRVSAIWKTSGGELSLDLSAVHIDSDAEWDESDLVRKLPVEREPDGTLSGTLEFAEKANSGRIRLSRTGDGSEPIAVRIERL